MNTSTFRLKNISKSFQQGTNTIEIFNNISCSIIKGHSYAIVGSSGIGKSTLIHMLAGIEDPSAGDILLDNDAISSLALPEKISILQKKIGIVFQQSLLIPELSVLENVMLKHIIQGTVIKGGKELAQQLLQEINLSDKAYCKPSTLSGGQQQRVALLRAIFNKPHFLLADEPTGNLDTATGQQIIDLLLSYQKKYAMGVIISTHDMNIARQMDFVIRIENKNIYLEKQN